MRVNYRTKHGAATAFRGEALKGYCTSGTVSAGCAARRLLAARTELVAAAYY